MRNRGSGELVGKWSRIQNTGKGTYLSLVNAQPRILFHHNDLQFVIFTIYFHSYDIVVAQILLIL